MSVQGLRPETGYISGHDPLVAGIPLYSPIPLYSCQMGIGRLRRTFPIPMGQLLQSTADDNPKGFAVLILG